MGKLVPESARIAPQGADMRSAATRTEVNHPVADQAFEAVGVEDGEARPATPKNTPLIAYLIQIGVDDPHKG